MFVDDHDLIFGNKENTVKVRISRGEIAELLEGKMITGQNKGGSKLTVILLKEDDPQKTSSR